LASAGEDWEFVLEVEPDRQRPSQEHGQDRPGAGAAEDAGQNGGELSDNERAIQKQGPEAGEAVAVEAGVAHSGVQSAVAGGEGDRGHPGGEGGDDENDGSPEGVTHAGADWSRPFHAY
jgi:hypothetical protein